MSCCREPTAELCADPEYIPTECGQALADATNADATHMCYGVLEDAHAEAAANLPTREVMTAPMTDHLNRTIAPATDRVEAGIDTPLYEPRVGGDGYNDFTDWYRLWRVYVYDREGSAYINRTEESRLSVRSCDEYVWEKYWDLNRYEYATRSATMTARDKFDVAFGSPFATESVGRKAALGVPIISKDGTPLDAQLTQPTEALPKNGFYAVGGALGCWLEQEWNDLPTFERYDFLGRVKHPWGMLLGELDETAVRDFAWHKNMSDSLAAAGELDEHLEHMQAAVKDFEHLAARADDAIRRHAHVQIQCATNADVEPLVPGGIGHQGDDVAYFGNVVLPECLATDPTSDLFDTVDCSKEAELRARADALFKAVKSRLVEARDMGCLSSGVGPCDWAPSMFVGAMTGQLSGVRRADLTQCLESTNDVAFTDLDDFGFDVDHDEISLSPELTEPQNYRASTSDLERYFENREQFVREVAEGLAESFGGDSGAAKLAESFSDDGMVGSEWFGAGYTINADWELYPLGNACNAADGSVSGMFRSELHLLTESFRLLEVDTAVSGNAPVNHFRLFFMAHEEAIVDREFSTELPQSAVLVDDTTDSEDEVKETLATFTVLGVPISVDGGFSSHAGVDYRIELLSNTGCDENMGFGIKTAFRPYVDANAFLTVVVDYVLLRAGVKGTLTLIDADMPVTIQLGLRVPHGEVSQMKLEVEATADLRLEVMSGRFGLYAELFFQPFEKTLVQWRGVQTRGRIMDASMSMPLNLVKSICELGVLDCS